MFTNLTKKIITGIMALSLAISGFVAIPAFAFAKGGHEDNQGKNNFGQAVSTWAHFKIEDENENFNFGIKGLLSVDALSTVSSSSFQIFRQEIKDAKTTEKQTDKTAKIQLKTDLNAATTQSQKKSAVKTFLNSLLSAFHTFAVAKEAALTKLINSL